MSVSAVMIAYNEEELLPSCLCFLESMKEVEEIICIVDNDTNDRTTDILEHYSRWSSKHIIWQKSEFTSFGAQRNKGLDLATCDWMLSLDPDEVFTPQLDDLLLDIKDMPNITAVRMPCITLYKDRRHYLSQDKSGLDPHIHLWRRGFARYQPEIHEDLLDIHKRLLHTCYDSDILSTHLIEKYHDVGMKHMQLLKSDAALVAKGLRWQVTGALEASGKKGIPVKANSWLEWKNWACTQHQVLPLPTRHYDITTDW